MSEDMDLVRTIRSRALAELAAGPQKPTYAIDGQEVRWTEYQEHLLRRVAWCDRRLADGEVYEFHSEFVPGP